MQIASRGTYKRQPKAPKESQKHQKPVRLGMLTKTDGGGTGKTECHAGQGQRTTGAIVNNGGKKQHAGEPDCEGEWTLVKSRKRNKVHRDGINNGRENAGHRQQARGDPTNMRTADDAVEGNEADRRKRSRDAMED